MTETKDDYLIILSTVLAVIVTKLSDSFFLKFAPEVKGFNLYLGMSAQIVFLIFMTTIILFILKSIMRKIFR